MQTGPSNLLGGAGASGQSSGLWRGAGSCEQDRRHALEAELKLSVRS